MERLQQGTRLLVSSAAVGVATLVLALLGTSALGVSAAQADTTDCTGAGSISTGNPLYAIENSNAPGGSACLTALSNGLGSYRVNSTSFDPNAPEAPAEQFIGYKAIYTGCKHNVCLESAQYPALASSILSEPTNWTFNFTSSGKYDAVYDMFFNKTAAQQPLPTGAELMVWLNHTSNLPITADGTEPNVTIQGQEYEVSSILKTTSLGSWNRIIFSRVNPTTSVTNLDMAPFIQAAEADGAVSPNWYEQFLEAGFEIWNGGVGLSTSSFSAPPPTIASSSTSPGTGPGGGPTGPGTGGTGPGTGGSTGPSAKDRTKPNVSLSLPVCSTTYSKKKCAAVRRSAGAWEKLVGFASDNVKVKRVTITAVRARKGRAPKKTITAKAKFVRGTSWNVNLGALTTGDWTFTATAIDTSGNKRTTPAVHVNINYGLSPFQHVGPKHKKK